MGRFRELDTLRYVFAMVVVLGHAAGWVNTVPQGSSAVDFFFTLSGFVLAHALIARDSGYRAFVQQRIARMFPLHLATLVLFIGAFFAVGWESALVWSDLPQNIVLLNGMRPNSFQFNWPSWSISIEFWINITLFYFVVAYRQRLLAILIAAAALVILRDYGASWWFNAWLFRGLFGLFAGYVAYEFYLVARDRLGIVLLPLIVVAGVGLVWSAAYTSPGANLVFRACTVALIALLPCGVNPVSAFLARERFAALGDWSFSVYLIHGPLLCWARGEGYLALKDNSIYQGGVFNLIAFCFAVTVLAWLTYNYFELPMKRVVLRWLRPQAVRVSAPG